MLWIENPVFSGKTPGNEQWTEIVYSLTAQCERQLSETQTLFGQTSAQLMVHESFYKTLTPAEFSATQNGDIECKPLVYFDSIVLGLHVNVLLMKIVQLPTDSYG